MHNYLVMLDATFSRHLLNGQHVILLREILWRYIFWNIYRLCYFCFVKGLWRNSSGICWVYFRIFRGQNRLKLRVGWK